MMRYYVLDENKQVIPADFQTWAKFMESPNIVIKQERFTPLRQPEITVSTVFLGMWDQIFETMIFNGELYQYQERCNTYEEALEQHQKAVDLVLGNTNAS